MNKLVPSLLDYWASINNNEGEAYRFLEIFGYYIREETLCFIYNKILEHPISETQIYLVKDNSNLLFSEKDKILKLLEIFFASSKDLKDCLEMAFEYIKKKPSSLSELIQAIIKQLDFDSENARNSINNQKILFDLLCKGVENKDSLYNVMFIEISKHFLVTNAYTYAISDTEEVCEIRQKIWKNLDEIFERYPRESIELLENYKRNRINVNPEIVQFDFLYILDIIKKYFKNTSFEHCKYVQEQIIWWSKYLNQDTDFLLLTQEFTNKIYNIYTQINFDEVLYRESIDNLDEYEIIRARKIENLFIFSSPSDVLDYYNILTYLKPYTDTYYYYTAIDYIVNKNFTMNFKLGCKFLILIANDDNSIEYAPKYIFENQLTSLKKANAIWNLIQNLNFKSKSKWQILFFESLKIDSIVKEYFKIFCSTILNAKNKIEIDPLKIANFLLIDSDIFQKILKISIERNNGKNFKIFIKDKLFSKFFPELGNDIGLIKTAYIQQDRFYDNYDYDNVGFINIFSKDVNFLYEYICQLQLRPNFENIIERKHLSFVWKIEGIEAELIRIFELTTTKDSSAYFSKHFCNAFFINLPNESFEKASKFLIDYCIENNNDYHKMNVVANIAKNYMKKSYEKILLTFLSNNQNVDVFSKIIWQETGATVSHINEIFSDIQAANWRNILSIVASSDVGFRLLPIKKYLNNKIERCLMNSELEKKNRFLGLYH